MHACMHVCMYACMHVCMYACMHVCMYACMHVCMHACMHVFMYACMHAYAESHTYVVINWLHQHINGQGLLLHTLQAMDCISTSTDRTVPCNFDGSRVGFQVKDRKNVCRCLLFLIWKLFSGFNVSRVWFLLRAEKIVCHCFCSTFELTFLGYGFC